MNQEQINPIHLSEKNLSEQKITEILSPFVTENRKARIEKILSERTKNYGVVVEGLYDHGNINAVMRTSESLGYLPFHIIETSDDYKKARRVSQGAERWLDIQKWKSTQSCFSELKKKGYQIAVSSLEDSTPLNEVDLKKPTLFVFGNEKDGITEEAKNHSDVRFKIPMHGMTQSFNISVAAAITLSFAREKIHTHFPQLWNLTDPELASLRKTYYQRSVPYSEKLINASDRNLFDAIPESLC